MIQNLRMEFNMTTLHDGLESTGQFPKECLHNQVQEGPWLCGKALRMGLPQAFPEIPHWAALGKLVQGLVPYSLHLWNETLRIVPSSKRFCEYKGSIKHLTRNKQIKR